jgi:hypothetical protein
MKNYLLGITNRYIFTVFFLSVLYIGINKESGIGSGFLFLTGNFYYVFLLFLAGRALVDLFVENNEWKEFFKLRLNYIWAFSFSLFNLIVLFSIKDAGLEEYINIALIKYNAGVMFVAFFSKIYEYVGNIGMYFISIPIFIFSFLVVFGKIIGYIVRFFIKLKKSDFLKNYRANLIENRIKRKEKRLNNELNKAQKKKKKKFEKLSKEIEKEEIRPKFNESIESEYLEKCVEDESVDCDENLENSYELQESEEIYEELCEEERDENRIFLNSEEETGEEIENCEDSKFIQEEIEFEEKLEEIEKTKEVLEENLFEEIVEDSYVEFRDEEVDEEPKEKSKEKGTFLLFHIFGKKEKDEKKEKQKILRKKRKDEEKQKRQNMKDKRKKLREELRSRNMQMNFLDKEDSFKYKENSMDKIDSNINFSEEDLNNIDYSEISKGLELELDVVKEGGKLYHLIGIQSPKELSERLNLTLIKATQLAIRLNNLKIGDKNDTGIEKS